MIMELWRNKSNQVARMRDTGKPPVVHCCTRSSDKEFKRIKGEPVSRMIDGFFKAVRCARHPGESAQGPLATGKALLSSSAPAMAPRCGSAIAHGFGHEQVAGTH